MPAEYGDTGTVRRGVQAGRSSRFDVVRGGGRGRDLYGVEEEFTQNWHGAVVDASTSGGEGQVVSGERQRAILFSVFDPCCYCSAKLVSVVVVVFDAGLVCCMLCITKKNDELRVRSRTDKWVVCRVESFTRRGRGVAFWGDIKENVRYAVH